MYEWHRNNSWNILSHRLRYLFGSFVSTEAAKRVYTLFVCTTVWLLVWCLEVPVNICTTSLADDFTSIPIYYCCTFIVISVILPLTLSPTWATSWFPRNDDAERKCYVKFDRIQWFDLCFLFHLIEFCYQTKFRQFASSFDNSQCFRWINELMWWKNGQPR